MFVKQVDRNQLKCIPVEIRLLTRLRVFCCDCQRPRGLTALPEYGMRALTNLEVLSCSDNRIRTFDSWLSSLVNLRHLDASRNRLASIPLSALRRLRHLLAVDLRYNPLDEMAPGQFALGDIVSFLGETSARVALDPGAALLRYYRCYSVAYSEQVPCGQVGPFQQRLQRDLAGQLDMSRRLAQSVVSGRGSGGHMREITVGVFGPNQAAKTSLVDALCSSTVTSAIAPGYDVRHFELRPPNGGGVSTTMTSFVSVLSAGSDTAFRLLATNRQLVVDVALLVVDLSSIDTTDVTNRSNNSNNSNNNNVNNNAINGVNNGRQVLSTPSSCRHVTRLKMWLRALGEALPDVPVLLIGTSGSPTSTDVWRKICELVLDPARAVHRRQYNCRQSPPPASSPSSNCILCSTENVHDMTTLKQRYVSAANVSGSSSNNYSTSSSSLQVAVGAQTVKSLKPTGNSGFVDLSLPRNEDPKSVCASITIIILSQFK